MNRLFNLLIISCIGVALLFALGACSSDKNDEPLKPELELKEETLNVNHEAQKIDYKFTATETWRVKTDAEWCELSRTQGAVGEITLALNLTENTSVSERTASVTIETIDGNRKFVDLTIKQAAKEIVTNDDTNPNAPAGMKSNASYLLKQIKVGWCLGNTCESGIWDGWTGNDLDIETNWGNPKTTQKLISAVKEAGFNAIRIPVRWYVHADGNLNINKAWMDRVKEIVDYAYNQGMYVVINSHHDDWYDRLPENYNEDEIKAKFATMWSGIAETFKSYDEHLIFAGVNEMIYLNSDGSENWGAPADEHVKLLGELMQIFVNTVRDSGDNNAWRCLMIQPWASNIDYAYHKDFKMPTDKVDYRLMLEFHNYTWTYSTEAAGEGSNKYFWGSPYSSYKPWYSDGESQIRAMYDKIKNTFIDNGIPVVMAEFGCVQHNKSTDEAVCDESRAYYHKFVVSEAKQRGIPGFYWDNGSFDGNGENFGLINRTDYTIPARAKIALDGIMSAF